MARLPLQRRTLAPPAALAPMWAGVAHAPARERALAVIRILNRVARQYRTAIVVVTPDEKIIPTFKRICHLRDGATHEGRRRPGVRVMSMSARHGSGTA